MLQTYVLCVCIINYFLDFFFVVAIFLPLRKNFWLRPWWLSNNVIIPQRLSSSFHKYNLILTLEMNINLNGFTIITHANCSMNCLVIRIGLESS